MARQSIQAKGYPKLGGQLCKPLVWAGVQYTALRNRWKYSVVESVTMLWMLATKPYSAVLVLASVSISYGSRNLVATSSRASLGHGKNLAGAGKTAGSEQRE